MVVELLGCCLLSFVELQLWPLQLHLKVQSVDVAPLWQSGHHTVAAAPPAPQKLVQLCAPFVGGGTEEVVRGACIQSLEEVVQMGIGGRVQTLDTVDEI